MYLIPASCRPLVEATLARLVKEIRAGELPEFGLDDKKPGWIAVGVVEIHEPVILSVR